MTGALIATGVTLGLTTILVRLGRRATAAVRTRRDGRWWL